MTHASDDVADQHVPLRRVRLGEHPLLAAAVAGDPEEPRRERPERLVQSFRPGRCHSCASADAGSGGRSFGGPAHDLAEQRIG
jgi:hypothetical protein